MTDTADPLTGARAAFERHEWSQARDGFRAADRSDLLTADDCYALAESQWWLGEIDEALAGWAQAYELYIDSDQPLRAAMSAMYLGIHALERGDSALGTGWMGRCRRLLAEHPERAEHGYPLYLDIFAALGNGEHDHALALARRVQRLGHDFRDDNLAAIGLLGEGRTLVKQGRVDDGLALIDESMVAATSDRLHPTWAGALYCHLMDVCHELGDLQRAAEWTQATRRWCERLPPAVLFRGICRIHRAQVLHVRGAWDEAEFEAGQACRDLHRVHVGVAAEGHYALAEIHRLRGDLTMADQEYERANELGRDPQPGLALARSAQGRTDAAVSGIRAALAAAGNDRLARARLCVAGVDIALAAGDLDQARIAAEELTATAREFHSSGLTAAADRARGAALLAAGDPERALPELRSACRRWLQLGAPYEAAKARELLGQVYRALGDEEASERALASAHATFTRLGADTDLRRVAALQGNPAPPGGLTDREVDVLRQVAAGKSNREIAAALVISEATVARHLANIYTKLDLRSRTAAAAYAYDHRLIDSV